MDQLGAQLGTQESIPVDKWYKHLSSLKTAEK